MQDINKEEIKIIIQKDRQIGRDTQSERKVERQTDRQAYKDRKTDRLSATPTE